MENYYSILMDLVNISHDARYGTTYEFRKDNGPKSYDSMLRITADIGKDLELGDTIEVTLIWEK
jgi:hypothetical protein